ncbi:MAG: type II secretion system F family protein [Deltaproteobacteria bacterium]|nr:type II secretion system F family protein [Deltaproteobacteria bacterium]
MDLGTIFLIIGGLIFLAVAAAVIAVTFLGGHKKTRVRELIHGVLSSTSTATPARKRELTEDDIEALKRRTADQKKKGQLTSILFRSEGAASNKMRLESTRFFQAGLFTADDRRKFTRLQLISPFVSIILCTGIMLALKGSALFAVLGLVLGLFIGISLPQTWIDRQIEKRAEDVRYFLPLAIEQIAIGVSSSLDIWPCISNILDMARERDSHNPVTELLMYVEKLIASGLNLQDALYEVAQASGIHQVKHTFRYLGQVAEHGGEISKQLQELADAVSNERQTDVEGRIQALPVKATGPLFLVFTGYFILMMSGIMVKLLTSFPVD